MLRFFKYSVLFLPAYLLAACSFSLADDITPPPGAQLQATPQVTASASTSPVYPIVPPDLANGARIFSKECVQCHGAKGMGDGPQAVQLSAPVASLGLSDFARHYTPAEWYQVVTNGNIEKYMPAFSTLTDRQRWDVVAYAMSLSIPDELIAQGKTLYQANCVSCHGVSGRGDGPEHPNLSTQPKDFTNQAYMAQASGASLYQAISSGIAPDMPAYTSTLTENERWSLVGYVRSLTFAAAPVNGNTYPAPGEASASTQAAQASATPNTYPEPAVTQTALVSPTSEVTPTITFLGSVAVQVINGSGGDAPSDIPVTLWGFDNMQNTYSDTLTTGVNGIYTFTNIVMPSGRVFMAGTDFDSGTYGSDIVTADPANPNLNIAITVYNSTTDVSILTTDRVHIFFDFTDPQNVQVVEVFIISNPSPQAVVSPTKDGTVLTFPLPEGYTDLQFQEGELGNRYLEVAEGFADKMTVNPGLGQYQVIFAFTMPYKNKLNFVQPMFLPTGAIVVMVPDNGVKVDSSMLQDGGLRTVQNNSYHMYNGSSLIAGSSLEFTLSGSPKTAGTKVFTSTTMQNLAIGLGVFGIALVLGGYWLFRRNRTKLALQAASSDDLSSPIAGSTSTPDDESTLMDAIIALDDQYHAGNLPEAAYLERRAVLKEKLSQLNRG